jgi:hypothetical protein
MQTLQIPTSTNQLYLWALRYANLLKKLFTLFLPLFKDMLTFRKPDLGALLYMMFSWDAVVGPAGPTSRALRTPKAMRL